MNYKEAIKHSITVPWKTATCNSGVKCWCRMIIPVQPIKDDDGEEIYIAGSGAINKIHAEHIVRIHNESLVVK